MSGARAIARCDELGAAPYSLHDDRLFRPYLSAAHLATRAAAAGWMREAGLSARVDGMGTLIGRSPSPPDAPCVMIGSHLDSVDDAGRYDGALGVTIGIEVAAALAQARLPFALEVVAFGDEEGSRFPASMLCSRALTEALPPESLEIADRDGVRMRTALLATGHDPDAVVPRPAGSVLAYVEPHIEQGPVLEALSVPVGVVTAIAGQTRLRARFTGTAGHAGTTPMRLRHDALAAAAEAVLAVERICGAGAPDLVGTVGRFVPATGAFNIICGAVEIGIDIRAAEDAAREAAVRAVGDALGAIAARRGIACAIETMQILPATPCDPALVALLAQSAGAIGGTAHRLASGAGHDAMVMAALAPVAMLFLRCAGGISHNPAERATAADADAAIRTLTDFVLRYARTLA